MIRNISVVSAFCLFTALHVYGYPANTIARNAFPKIAKINERPHLPTDTVPPPDIMDVITAVINSTNSFNIGAVANLYTPNAVIADDEPPYSWNGPTAGVQWVNSVEKACKDNRLTKLKGTIEPINVYQLSEDNVYIIVPVDYSGNLPGRRRFSVKGAFTFVLRNVNGKWMIKSQAWTQEKGITGK